MPKKIVMVILCVAFTVSLFAGCSQKAPAEAGASDQSASGASTNEGNEQPAGKQSAIKFTYWGSPVEKKAIENAIASFEEAHPNIKVNAIHIPNDFYTKLTAMIAGNETPDISYSAAWKLKMGQDGIIYEFNELAKTQPEMNLDGVVEYCQWNWAPEKVAGPFQASVTPSLMYNADLFKEANVELPPTNSEEAWTWDKFVEAAQRLTLDNKGRNAADPDFDAKNIKQFGIKIGLGWNGYMPMVLSNGGNYLTQDGKEFGLNKPEAAAAIQKIADLINVYKVHPSPSQISNLPSPSTALQSKRVAMCIDGSWNHADLATAGFNWGVGVLPVINEYKTFFHGGSLVIFKATKDLDATCKFYNWVTDPDKVLELHQGLWLPQLKDWYTEPALVDKWASESLPGRPAGFQEAVLKSTFENSVLAPENGVVNFDQIDPLVAAALDQVWAGKKTAQEAMDEIEDKVKPLIGGWYFN